MALKLSLKPGEKFVLNGAVVQNGDRRGVLILQNRASAIFWNSAPKTGTFNLSGSTILRTPSR